MVTTSSPVLTIDETRLLARLVRWAFLLRALVAVALHFSGLSSRFAPDEITYASTGEQLALFWSGDTLVRPYRMESNQPLGYFYLNGVSFYVFGSVVPLKLLNALIGSLACRYAYLLAHSLYGSTVARWTAQACAFLPSLVLWASVNIRDVWVIFLILYLSWLSVRLLSGYSTSVLLKLLAAMAAITTLRPYLFVVIALPPVVAAILGGRGHLVRNFVVATLLAVGLVVLVGQGAAESAFERMSLEDLAEARRDLAYQAGSAFEQEADISTPAGALAFLPIGVAYFLFSPFPWQITSLLKAASVPEMLFLYWLTPAVIRGIRHVFRHYFLASIQVTLLTLLLTVSYALGSGNVGTLYRHRAQAITFYLMFGAVGRELATKRSGKSAQLPASGRVAAI